MKSNYRLLLFFFLISCFININKCFSQTNSLPYNSVVIKKQVCHEIENTYQVLVVNNPRAKVALTDDVCLIVKEKRKLDETVIYKYDESIKLKIYSSKERENFKIKNIILPLIMYVNE